MHFDITLNRTAVEPELDKARVYMDDVDITAFILTEGFRVDLNEADEPVVHMRLRPDSIKIHGVMLADAELTKAPEPLAVDPVCLCGHAKSDHSTDRADDFGCYIHGCYESGTCSGWQAAS